MSQDFLPVFFFFKLFLLGPVDMPRNDFDFFRLLTDIFDYFGASPASTTPAKHALQVSLTPVSNSSPVSTTPVSDTFTVLESFIGVNDTGKKISDTEPIRYRTFLIPPDLSDNEPVRYRTYQRPNLSDTEPI